MARTAPTTTPATPAKPNYHVSYDELSQVEKEIYNARANRHKAVIRRNYSEEYREDNDARRREMIREFLG